MSEVAQLPSVATTVEACKAEVQAVLEKHGCVLVGESVPRYVNDGRGGWTLVIDTRIRVERKAGG